MLKAKWGVKRLHFLGVFLSATPSFFGDYVLLEGAAETSSKNEREESEVLVLLSKTKREGISMGFLHSNLA